MDQDYLNYTELRRKAESQLAYAPPTKRMPPPTEKMLHELQVHQIELEMQNEQLRQAQIELEKSRDLYMNYYDFAPIGYLTLNRSGMIDQINLTGAAMLRAERNKIQHRRFDSYIVMEDRDRWHRYFTNLLSRDATLTCELGILNGDDGSHLDARLDCRRSYELGNELKLHIMVIDVTESKKANLILMQHKIIIDTAIDGFWMTDEEGNLLEANAAYAKMSGYSVEELKGMHISQLDAKEQLREEVKAHITKIIAQGYDRFETIHRHKDGHEIDIEVSVTYMPESQQFSAFCRNITERKKIEKSV